MPAKEPLLPVKNRLESFWLSERDPELCKARTTSELPGKADIVVVGSGIAGALFSYLTLEKAKQQGMSLKIVMLEADECTGSSTARNGGHCKPVTYSGYNTLKAKHGKDIANACLELEENALGVYADIVLKEGIDCDLHVTRTFDIFYDEADAKRGRQDFLDRKKDHPEAFKKGDVRETRSAQETERVCGVKGAKWSANYPAGSMWPYKFATSLIRICIERHGLNLQTYTSASGLERTACKSAWRVKTSRGEIKTPLVITATNAYTASVLPDFETRIFPIRGTASSITPSPSHSLGGIRGPIKYSYGFRHGTGDTDYMIARQGRKIPGVGDKSIILGGAKSTFLKQHDLWYNNKNDNEYFPHARRYFQNFMPERFADWDGGDDNVDTVWSGVLGYSSDFKPYVGEHPDKKGVFVCAGFTGHGMPLIPNSTIALSAMAIDFLQNKGSVSSRGQKQFDEYLPLPIRLTRERYDNQVNVIKEMMGQGGGAQGAIETSDEAAMMTRAKL